MNYLILVLRIMHIFSGVFWVGVSFFNIGYLQPAVRATGAEGQTVMQYLTQRTRLLSSVYGAATLTLLSGLVLYWILLGFRLSVFRTGYGIVLTVGALAGLVAWLIAVLVIRGILSQMQAVGREIQAQGNPPSPQQAAQLQALAERLGKIGQVGVVFMAISLVGMAAAQYASF